MKNSTYTFSIFTLIILLANAFVWGFCSGQVFSKRGKSTTTIESRWAKKTSDSEGWHYSPNTNILVLELDSVCDFKDAATGKVKGIVKIQLPNDLEPIMAQYSHIDDFTEGYVYNLFFQSLTDVAKNYMGADIKNSRVKDIEFNDEVFSKYKDSLSNNTKQVSLVSLTMETDVLI